MQRERLALAGHRSVQRSGWLCRSQRRLAAARLCPTPNRDRPAARTRLSAADAHSRQTRGTQPALATFERCRTILREELGLDPEPETLSLHAQILNSEVPNGTSDAYSQAEADDTTQQGRANRGVAQPATISPNS